MFGRVATSWRSGFRRSVAVVFAALALLPQTPSSAREPSQEEATERTSKPPGPRTEAEIRYSRGVEAFRARRYREAADEFEKADELAPSAAYAYNVGLALDRLGDTGGALEAYRQYLRRRLNADNAGDVLARIARLEAKLAEQGLRQLTITSQPPGAAVAIDGAAVGVTPWTSELPEGSHRVRISLQGYATVLRKIDLSSTRTRDLDFRLARTREPEKRPTQPRRNASEAGLAPDRG
jgi:tetratricopeptide (TPR) repeat protein